jgi:uncharacterized protein
MKRRGMPTFLTELSQRMSNAPAGADHAMRFAVRKFAGPTSFVDEMSPLRVAHVTDQHVGRVTAMKVQHRAVELVNQGAPDVVMLTGDFVCHSLDYLDALTEVVSGIHAPTFAVLGNHDHWSGADEVRRALARGGVCVLDNAHTTITLGDHQPLQIVGLDDAYTGHADRARATLGLRTDVPTIGLSHIAEEADGLWARGVPLVLSGHTHAGQVTLAGLHELTIGQFAGHKYVHGLYGHRDEPMPRGAVYVGAGVGAGIVPLRVGERATREVTFFELGRRIEAVHETLPVQAPLPGRAPPDWLKKRRAYAVVKKKLKREATVSWKEARRNSQRPKAL